jgi:hypothetical protein
VIFLDRVDISDSSFWEATQSVLLGAAGLTVFLFVAWRLVIRRLWERGRDPDTVERTLLAVGGA